MKGAANHTPTNTCTLIVEHCELFISPQMKLSGLIFFFLLRFVKCRSHLLDDKVEVKALYIKNVIVFSSIYIYENLDMHVLCCFSGLHSFSCVHFSLHPPLRGK